MSSLSLQIIDEFLRSSDPQARKNALTALGVVGDSHSASRLVKTAFADVDATVRARAEAEIVRLRSEPADDVARELEARLADRADSPRAYAMLARLASQGWSVVRPSGNWLTRVRRVWRFTYSAPLRLLQLMWLARSALGGVVLASIVLVGWLILITGMRPALPDVLGMMFSGSALAAFVVVFAFVRSLPLRDHFDTTAAAIIELLHTLLAASGTALLVLGYVVLSEAEVWWMFRLLSCGVAASVAARVGALLVAGHFERRWNRVAQAFVGAIAGATAAVVMLVLAGALDTDDVVGARQANLLLLPYVLAAAGFAFAASRFDADPPVRPPFPRPVAVLTIATTTVLFLSVVVLGTGYGRVGPSESRPHRIEAESGPHRIEAAAPNAATHHSFYVTGNVTRVDFSATFTQRIRVELAWAGDGAIRLLRRDGAQVDVHDDPDPPTLDLEVGAGDYVLVAGHYRSALDYNLVDEQPRGSEPATAPKLPLDSILPLLILNAETNNILSVRLNVDGAR